MTRPPTPKKLKCQECGRTKNHSSHIKYGPDLDNPVKHEFMPAALASQPDVSKLVESAWLITTGGEVGRIVYFGTEKEAEEMRRHCARWEGAVSRKEKVMVRYSDAARATLARKDGTE